MARKTLRVNLAFLHGFMEGDVASTPLTLMGNEDVLVLTKHPGFRRWVADESVLADGRKRNEADRETLHKWIDSWFDEDEQFEIAEPEA